MLTRILASSVRIIPWTLGSPFLTFFITGGILCACDGLTKIHKSYGGGGVQLYIYIYIYIYICVGPYEIRLNFSQIPFYFFVNSFFPFQFLWITFFSVFILWTPF